METYARRLGCASVPNPYERPRGNAWWAPREIVPPVKAILGLNLLFVAMLYGYCLAAQPRYATPGATRVAEWTFRQTLGVRCLVAFGVWLVWMTGLYYFARGTG